jgi:hypothetical protein
VCVECQTDISTRQISQYKLSILMDAMKNMKKSVFQTAMDIVRNRAFTGWSFRLFQIGAARTSPIVMLSPAGIPPVDPLACFRFVPVETLDGVYRAVVRASEAREAVAFVCSVPTVATDLLGRFFAAGAMPVGA